jgi:hypothetical protein
MISLGAIAALALSATAAYADDALTPGFVEDVKADGGPPAFVDEVKDGGGPPAWVDTHQATAEDTSDVDTSDEDTSDEDAGDEDASESAGDNARTPEWVADVVSGGGPPAWVDEVKSEGGPPSWNTAKPDTTTPRGR